ncbi:MAG: hypothetical protein M1828_002315 [Chrysothrix sp. TS-e1954]|nr:MAG: hypothetical protein M1828_002315 [Chrysothrix sp. TS-e1954]
MKATWLGHASWLVETGTHTQAGRSRGVRILLDPVFAERTSPLKSLGPKRYTPTPCKIEELPEIDMVCISHNHYDHLDIDAINFLHARSKETHFFCGLNGGAWFQSLGIDAELVHELDWWDYQSITVKEAGSLNVMCTPAQHSSARGPFDKDKTLWCSWALGETEVDDADISAQARDVQIKPLSQPSPSAFGSPRLFFAGDTGYRSVDKVDPTSEEAAQYPSCPAFKEIGETLGPFDLALLPIGLFMPRNLMSPVHCSPEDSVCVHQDIKSKRSIGMHYGTVRGGISGQYEPVTVPPMRWQRACESAGLKFGRSEDSEAGLCDVGETVVVA